MTSWYVSGLVAAFAIRSVALRFPRGVSSLSCESEYHRVWKGDMETYVG